MLGQLNLQNPEKWAPYPLYTPGFPCTYLQSCPSPS